MTKLYISKENNCYINQAIEYKLFKKKEEGAIYFWINSDCVVSGQNQNIYNEVDVDFAKKNKINLTRRVSGGGSVFHDLGNLNYTYYTKTFDEKIIKLVLEALKHFKFNAEFLGRNDLCLDGKKISGLAYYEENGFYFLHGCLMFDVDKVKLSKVLNPTKTKVTTDAIKSIIKKVTNLNDYNKITIDEFINYFKKGREVIYLDRSFLTKEEINFFDNKERIFSYKDDYEINFEYKKSNVFCNVKEGIITEIKIFHDFLDYKFNLNSFIGKPFNKEEIENYLEEKIFKKRKKRK